MNRRSVHIMATCVAIAGVAVTSVRGLLAQQRISATVPSRADIEARILSTLLARKVSIAVAHVSLDRAIDAAMVNSGVTISYHSDVVGTYTHRVTLQATNVSLGTVLGRILAGTELHVIADGPAQLAIVRNVAAMSAEQPVGGVTGTVIDAATKRPLADAKVTIDHTTQGGVTGADGRFRLSNITAGPHQIVIRLIGYVRQVKSVTVVEGQITSVEFALDVGANTLDQIVVTGTVAATERKAIPNTITVITAKQIEERGITHIDQLFRGDVPGVFASNVGSGSALDQVVMYSRGVTALSAVSTGLSRDPALGITFQTNPIKTYVDGVEMADPKYLSQIDPKSIERIEILTGPQASTIYGSNAINGVMQIFTKRGTTAKPQITLSLQSGVTQNNFSSALAPSHDASMQLSGVEGRLAYSAGGSWNYVGSWTPGKQTTRSDAFGGLRFPLDLSIGRVTSDVTLRYGSTINRQHGDVFQSGVSLREAGWWQPIRSAGVSKPTTAELTGQALGFTMQYVPTTWWTHEAGIAQDASDVESRVTARGYAFPFDSTLQLNQDHIERQSLHYTTTARVTVTSLVQATVTAGTDGWRSTAVSWSASPPQLLTGTLSGPTNISRQPSHNTGGFLQTQLAVHDRLFVTYGLRAEWNPGFGAEASPNYAPRCGLAYTQDIETPVGAFTAKLRGSYGRSTRPPDPTLKAAVLFNTDDRYDPFNSQLANPELGPEHQQGGEGGLELYLGTRGSLSVTRYNQTVDGLIVNPKVDSVRSKVQTSYGDNVDVDGYAYMYQRQYLNVASIRNQGWELQGSVNTGPLTTRGTYSWTTSQTIGVTPKYRSVLAGSQYLPGARFNFSPEHTWALGFTYAHVRTTLGLNVTGVGSLVIYDNAFTVRNFSSNIRLAQNKMNMNVSSGNYTAINSGYAMADLTGSHQVSSRLEGIMQVQNLMDYYRSDVSAFYATMGRQVKVGIRVR